MAKPEERLYQAIGRRVKKLRAIHPIFFWRTHGGGRTKRGIPDVSLTFYGFSVYAELKAAGGKPTPLQLRRIDEIRMAGGFAAVCYSVDDFDRLLVEVLRFVQLDQAREHRPADREIARVCRDCRRPASGEFCACCIGPQRGHLAGVSLNLDEGPIW